MDTIDQDYQVLRALGQGLAGEVYLVQKGKQKLALKLLKQAIGGIRIGDPADDATDMGSLIHAPALDKVAAYVDGSAAEEDDVEHLRERVATQTRIVLCCRTGLRAWRAGNRLRAAGHENVVLLAAGD